jgi:transposase-like protein
LPAGVLSQIWPTDPPSTFGGNGFGGEHVMIEFKGSHFERDVILWAVRWYVAYPISYRQLEEMMAEHGVEVDHATLNRWVLKYVPLLDQEFRARKRPLGPSWRMDETYVRVKGAWKYLYRAVDKAGATVDFLLTAKRDRTAALRFLRKAIKGNGTPEKITIDKSGANTAAIDSHNAELRRASRSVRSNTSTTSSNRIIEPSSGWCGRCWGSSPSDQPR